MLKIQAMSKQFYHIKNLQGTKTNLHSGSPIPSFYHIKNLQGTKTL